MQTVRSGNANVPILASSESETQVQIPFDVTGSALSLALESSAGRRILPVPLEAAAPGIFIDRDGTPMILDADAGITLDAMLPARSGQRIQILTTGMGRVVPAWQAGVPAPTDDPPRVAAAVKVFMDRVELEVVRATLAPRYIGFYLIEVRLPDLVNAGPAELYITADGAESNRVRLYVEP